MSEVTNIKKQEDMLLSSPPVVSVPLPVIPFPSTSSDSPPPIQTTHSVSELPKVGEIDVVPQKKKKKKKNKLPSIFNSPNFPPLTDPEKQILLNMFNRWPLSSRLCLIDLFGIDLMTDWNALIKSVWGYSTFSTSLGEAKEMFFGAFLKSFTYFIGKRTIDDAVQKALLHPEYFKTEEAMIAQFGCAIKFLDKIKSGIERGQVNSNESLSKKSQQQVKEIKKNNNQKRLILFILFLNRCYNFLNSTSWIKSFPRLVLPTF